MTQGPLHGIRIVDLPIALSGPWAVGILADRGADVGKVELPGIGASGAGSVPRSAASRRWPRSLTEPGVGERIAALREAGVVQ